MERYNKITNKNPREIVLLKGRPCAWGKCRFCDYIEDNSRDVQEMNALNQEVLSHVTGELGVLEVINSGSFTELDKQTCNYILRVCKEQNICLIHFECHWLYREQIQNLRQEFTNIGVEVKIKIGVETFDHDFRENVLHKGIGEANPMHIAAPFDEVCLLFGLGGQTSRSMERDIQTGLAYFERVCVNVMVENSTPVKPNREVIRIFLQEIYPKYIENPRVDILINNTDFGVGA